MKITYIRVNESVIFFIKNKILEIMTHSIEVGIP
jgi:hypothetical protein